VHLALNVCLLAIGVVMGISVTAKPKETMKAMEEVQAVGASGAGEAIEVGDEVHMGEIARAGIVM
jgi:hypothetical protein